MPWKFLIFPEKYHQMVDFNTYPKVVVGVISLKLTKFASENRPFAQNQKNNFPVQLIFKDNVTMFVFFREILFFFQGRY